jgi:hypothetical protein
MERMAQRLLVAIIAIAVFVSPLPLHVSKQFVASAQDAPSATPSAVVASALPLPTADPTALATFMALPAKHFCENPEKLSLQEAEFFSDYGLLSKCEQLRAAGVVGRSIYGYEHPTPTACNAGNTARNGLLGFITNRSIGSTNIFVGIGLLLGVLFAGCNNTTSPSLTSTPAPSVSIPQAKDSSAPTPPVAAPASPAPAPTHAG